MDKQWQQQEKVRPGIEANIAHQERESSSLNADYGPSSIDSQWALCISLHVGESVGHLSNQQVEHDHLQREQEDQVRHYTQPTNVGKSLTSTIS